jgi:hypothetical protein
MIKALQ